MYIEQGNMLLTELAVGLDSYEDNAFFIDYQDGFNEAESASKPRVRRFGINPYNLSEMKQNTISKDKLHPLENHLLLCSIDHLYNISGAVDSMQPGIKNSNYPNNIVLVDIFERNDTKQKFTKGDTGFFAVHTIVLWKKADKEICVIDPSQEKFSLHVVDVLRKQLLGDQIIIYSSGIQNIYGTSIYKNNAEIGYSDYQDVSPKARDCIDIAVKLAFELNEKQKESGAMVESILPTVTQNISNNKQTAEYLNQIDHVVIRELHSSDSKLRVETKEHLLKFRELSSSLAASKPVVIDNSKIKNYQNIQGLLANLTVMEKVNKELNEAKELKVRTEEEFSKVRSEQRLSRLKNVNDAESEAELQKLLADQNFKTIQEKLNVTKEKFVSTSMQYLK